MNIKKMLPYLCKEDLNSLLEACVKGEITEEDFKVPYLYPFLEPEQLMTVLRSAMEGTINVSPKGILPFLEEEQIDELLNELQETENDKLAVDDLLPFLEDKQVRKLFGDILEKSKNKTE
ncbi:MAG TPA: hypothetical protein PLH02_04835 [Bacillota bacterium]|mgnify:CR=1 FL=1|nr:hypothetical protein [Bacillota bacterium]HPF42558.1 hypothetical protein [Bacillota bacterium]HPJ85884.1 hypothetical protein [Bacillota bacterium]HPQ62174.1 hypothetical protein [Bacillota bacterium]HRX91582.1 hypothetical protein [Candidatus Izemoplasmatales bacterium]